MMAVRIATLIGAVLLLSSGSAAPQTGSAHVVGRVTDETGSVLPGVVVTIISRLGVQRQVVSQADGRFDVSVVPPSAYTLTFELHGFEVESRDVTITTPGSTVDASLALRLGRLCEPGLTVIRPFIDVAITS